MQQPPQPPYGPPQLLSQPPAGYPQYPPQQPPYPNYQQPPLPPRKPSAPARFFRFVRRHPILSGIVGVALIIMIIIASIQNAQTPTTGAVPTATPGIQTQATTAPTSAPTTAPTQAIAPTTAPTSAPAAIIPTHGTPLIGGKISDFYGKYGTPNNQGIGNSQTWIVGTDQVFLNARPDASNNVTYISATGPSSWSDVQTSAYCEQFLPSDASQFNHVSNLTDYHSSVGEIVLTNLGQGVCTIYTAGS